MTVLRQENHNSSGRLLLQKVRGQKYQRGTHGTKSKTSKQLFLASGTDDHWQLSCRDRLDSTQGLCQDLKLPLLLATEAAVRALQYSVSKTSVAHSQVDGKSLRSNRWWSIYAKRFQRSLNSKENTVMLRKELPSWHLNNQDLQQSIPPQLTATYQTRNLKNSSIALITMYHSPKLEKMGI